MAKKKFPNYIAEELVAFRADPKREEALGIAEYVVCRECGGGHALITAQHLRRPGHAVPSGSEYQAKWNGAPLACVEKRLKQKTKMAEVWKSITAQERANWINNSKNALNTPEGKRAISDGTKLGLSKPEARAKISQSSKRAWDGNTVRRDRASEVAKNIFSDPDVVQRRIEGHAKLETRRKIGAATKRSFRDNPERGRKVSDRKKQWWAEQKKLIETRRPPDWWDKSTDYRIIATELLAGESTTNKELAKRLDGSRILKCPYAPTWSAALSTRGFLLLVNAVRKWIKMQGGRKKTAA